MKTHQKSPRRASKSDADLEAPSSSKGKDKVGHLGYADQVAALSPMVQLREGSPQAGTDHQVLAASQEGTTGGGGALPFGDRIQEAFGRHDVGAVQAHTGNAAAKANASMGSTAYATGNHVVFGTTPDLFTAAHEAAHVVQARHGVQLRGGVGQSGDPYEQHADRVAAAVVSGQSAEGILDKGVGTAHASSASAPPMTNLQFRATTASGPLDERAVRRAIAFCSGRPFTPAHWAKIGSTIGSTSSTVDATMVQAIATFQRDQGLSVDGCPGDVTIQWLSEAPGGEGLDALIKNDRVVYLGFNPGSRGPELNAIRDVVGRGGVTGATGRREEDTAVVGGETVQLDTEDGLETFVGSLRGLDGAQKQKLVAFFEDLDSESMDELAQFVRILHDAETGRRVMKRVVFSGHSGGWSIWGDDNGGVDFEQLAALTPIFSRATGQVEDLMLSACNTAQKSKLEQYTKIFPNLKTIWGYVGYSPSAATGSLKHIKGWAGASGGALDADKMNESREMIAGQTGKRDLNIALWTREEGVTDYQTASPYAGQDYPTARAAVDGAMGAYMAAYDQGTINLEELSGLYTQLQNLVGNHQGSLGDDFAHYDLVMRHVLYLRHWPKICQNFMAEHGAEAEAAWGRVSQPTPDFANLSRAECLEVLDAWSGDTKEPGFVLVRDTLGRLNPDLIKDTWV